MAVEVSELETNYDKSAAKITVVFFSDDPIDARYKLTRILKKILDDEDVVSVAGDLIRNED